MSFSLTGNPRNSGRDNLSSMDEQETQSFLPGEKQNEHLQPTDKPDRFGLNGPKPWQYATVVLTILLAISAFLRIRDFSKSSYETGFDTDLGELQVNMLFLFVHLNLMVPEEPALHAIQMRRIKFPGNIIVNETGEFEVMLDPDSPRYTGHPTRELDAAWDRLVGKLLLKI
jgi:hypothetical protein